MGEFFFEIFILLRESIFVNGILTTSEIWYSITREEIKEMENLDMTLLRKIFKVPYSTPSEAYYLELGILSLETIIKKRREVRHTEIRNMIRKKSEDKRKK